jgi:hypothetical protein
VQGEELLRFRKLKKLFSVGDILTGWIQGFDGKKRIRCQGKKNASRIPGLYLKRRVFIEKGRRQDELFA